jgi:radical SAM superfamily enzyme YgiQ (UPF0313 family)
MKILIINEPFVSGFCRSQRWAAKSRARAQRHPDWLCYAAAVLEKAGEDIELYDFPPKGWGKDKLESLVKEKQPGIVILDSTTPSIYSDIECAKICKAASGCKIIMVGPHASSESEETLRISEGAVDFIARGEYDYTLRELVSFIKQGRTDVDKVLGISFLKGNVYVSTPNRPLIDNLDELPYPAYHFLNIWDYFDGGKLFPFLTIEGGRGCPFKCDFCLWPQVMHGRKFRLRSAKNIVDELEYWLKKWPLLKYGEFFFEDDTFTANRKRAHDICDEILKRNLKVTWSVNARADIVDEEMFDKMHRAGCRIIWLGVESADQGILDRCHKGTKIEQVTEFIKLAHKYKLQVHGCFVFGLPGETEDTMKKTLAFALSAGLDTLQFSGAVPFPGTEYFDYCKSNNLIKAKKWSDWLLEDGEQKAVIEYPGLSSELVEKYVNLGLKKFYFNPGYLVKFLFRSRGISDIYRKFRGGLNFLSYLLSGSKQDKK